MSPKIHETLVPLEMLRSDMAVFDAVYTPGETRLLREARQAGALTVPGLGMFVHQAAIQFEMWTDTDAPVDVMTEAALQALGDDH
jgi:shikimate dehydrogenase